MRSIQAEGKDDIMRLSKQIAQLQVAEQKPQITTISNPQQSGSEKDGNEKKVKQRVKGKVEPMAREVAIRG